MNRNFRKRKLATVALFAALCVSLVLVASKTNHSLETTRPESSAQAQAEEPAPTNAEEALDRLLKGNERFAAGSLRHGHESVARRKELIDDQHPFATVLGCSDSRAPIEMLFDQGLGDLFVVRVAGNVVGTNQLGSIEYAVDHLHTPLLLVLGHEDCGAVTAALEPETARSKEAKGIKDLLALILPALKGIDPKLNPKELVSRGVESNVRWTIQRLQNAPDLKISIAAGQLRIVGGVYELETGKVRLLN